MDYVDSDCRMEKYEEVEVEIPCKIEIANIRMEGDLWRVDSNSKVILTFDTCLLEEQEGEFYVYFSDSQCMDKDFATVYIGDTKLHVVDGKRTPVGKTNIGCMILRLEKGEHEVEFRYEPWYFNIGILCTIIGGMEILILSRNGNLKGQ